MTATPPPRLRESQRSFTRSLLCDAARQVFAERGFQNATMEQIASVAGMRRSTLYNHFDDRNALLAAIAADYFDAVKDMVARLPAPAPDFDAILGWTRELARFSEANRTPTIILMSLAHPVETPSAISQLGVLAERIPAFRTAITAGPDRGLALARAQVVMHQIGRA